MYGPPPGPPGPSYRPFPPGPPGPPFPPPPPRRSSSAPLLIVLGAAGAVLLLALVGALAVLGGQESDGPEATAVSAPPRATVNPNGVPAGFSGTWTGTGYYHNSNGVKKDFTATLTLAPNAATGTSVYTGFACSGDLRVESAAPDKLVFYETITRGAEAGGNCASVPTGYVALTLRGDGRAQYSWYSDRRHLDDDDSPSQAVLDRGQQTT